MNKNIYHERRICMTINNGRLSDYIREEKMDKIDRLI